MLHRRALPPPIAEWPTTLLMVAILVGAVWLAWLIF